MSEGIWGIGLVWFMIKDVIIKYRGILLFTIGSLLILLSIMLLLYDRVTLVKEQVLTDFELLINNDESNNEENNTENNDTENGDNGDDPTHEEVDVNTGYLDENAQNSSNDIVVSDDDINASKDNDTKKNYIGYLEIPRISLRYGFVAKNSYYNHVNRNIQVINVSDFPDIEGGNLIIAGHSGNSRVSYFKNLYKLKIGDIAKVTYKNNLYTYKIVDIYKEKKDGSITIKRDMTKTTLTLITCTYRDEKTQTVYIAELDKVVSGGAR